MDWMAHLAHTLGGAPEGGFHISDLDEKEEDLLSMGGMDLPGPGGREATLVARCADRAPRHVQQKLHDLLAGRLAAGSEPRVIVTSEPIDVTNGDESGVYVDLFAFLYPSMIHVPPLRSRTEDIAPLMSFLAFKRNAEDPVPRINAAAILALQSYHWPRNVEELESVTRFILERKPAGEIGLGDLPRKYSQSTCCAAADSRCSSQDISGGRVQGPFHGRKAQRHCSIPDRASGNIFWGS